MAAPDPAAPDPAHVETRPIVLFDGVCNLCNGAVTFVIDRDPEATLAFAPLQSSLARERIAAASRGESRSASASGDSIVLLEEGRVHTRSTAALRIARRLRRPWPLLGVFLAVPAPLRDALYDLIARHRYRLFGRTETCRLPTPDTAARFVARPDDAPPRGEG